MFKLTGIVFGLLIVVQVVSANLLSSLGVEKIEPVKEINEYLESKLLNNKDLEQNLNAAIEWKRELGSWRKDNRDIIKVLSSLEALREIMKSPRCDKPMYLSVENTGQTVGSECFDPNLGLSRLSRTQLVVRLAAQQIGELCYKKHKAEFDSRFPSMNQTKIEAAKALTRLSFWKYPAIRNQDICSVIGREKTDFAEYIMNILNWSKENIRPEYKYLRMVKNDEGERVVMEDKVREVVQELIIEPCRYVTSELADLIPGIRVDSVFMETKQRSWLKQINSPFDSLVATYCVCKFFANGEDVIKQAIISVPYAKDMSLQL